MNIASIIDGHAADSVAVVSRGNPTTFGELHEQVARLAGGLRANGVQTGDRVAVISANNWYFVVGYLATLHAGAIAVPLNPRSPRPEIEHQLVESGATVVIAGPTASRRLTDEGPIPSIRMLIGAHPDATAEVTSFDDMLASDPIERIERSPDDIAVLMFTSGTAGGPKAAMLTHGNLRSNIDQVAAHSSDGLGPSDTVLAVLPFCHIYGINIVLGYALWSGAKVVLVENFDPANAVESIKRHAVTSFAGVPSMFKAILDLPGVDPSDMSTLRRIACGASALPAEVFEEFCERFGMPISEGYGLTEASPAVTSSTGHHPEPGCVGTVLPGVELRLVDEGHDALVGDTGEVWVRGPNVFAGYWNDPEATASVLDRDGWLHTGDIGVIADDGTLSLVDRIKDIVIVSGFNVFPGEVESVLSVHPGVAEVVVAGVPHPHTGEAVVAHVVLNEGAMTDEDELIAFCERQLPRYKAPSKIRFVDELPRNAIGKVTRRLLA